MVWIKMKWECTARTNRMNEWMENGTTTTTTMCQWVEMNTTVNKLPGQQQIPTPYEQYQIKWMGINHHRITKFIDKYYCNNHESTKTNENHETIIITCTKSWGMRNRWQEFHERHWHWRGDIHIDYFIYCHLFSHCHFLLILWLIFRRHWYFFHIYALTFWHHFFFIYFSHWFHHIFWWYFSDHHHFVIYVINN